MEIRELGFDDIFHLSNIIDKMEIKSDLNGLFDEVQKKIEAGNVVGAQAFLGGQIALLFFGKLHKAKEEIYVWFASLTGKSKEEIGKLGIKELTNLIKALLNTEGILELFQLAGANPQ